MKRSWRYTILSTIIIIMWLALASIGGPTFGKLSSVSSNDQASFLPANAQSTKVATLQSKFAGTASIPAIVVIESQTPLMPADYATDRSLVQTIQSLNGVEMPSTANRAPVVGPIPSQDNKAVEYIVPISDTKNVDGVVSHLRSALDKKVPKTTHVYVTGPAGLSADLVSAFGGIDGILLLVAVLAVFVILILVYRAVLLPFIVLITASFALTGAIFVVYLFASWGWIQLNGQSQGILSILVIGAATDYSLLIIARYKESLHQTANKWVALKLSYKASLEPIAASAATVILALLCLLFSDLNSNRSLGPIAAIGILFSFLSALSLLPALLAVFGKSAFWPFIPRIAPNAPSHKDRSLTGLEQASGLWRRIGYQVSKHPARLWIGALIILLIGAGGILQLKAAGVPQTDVILSKSNAVDGQAALARHFDAGSGNPIEIVTSVKNVEAIIHQTSTTNGITNVMQNNRVVNGTVLVNATLRADPYSQEAQRVVADLRSNLSGIDQHVLVGGATATTLDTNTTARNDLYKIIPIVLFVILIILILLLRSVVAPLLLIISVALSYIATLGISALVFNTVFHFPGADPSVPLFGFIFLVALGVDYNIFLMTRVREESLRLGTRAGIVRGLTVTGGVITSAGIVLAATFAALGVIPILFLAQIAFIVAFGVLLDTLIVRTLLVPALSFTIGKSIWWPSKLWRSGKP